MGKFHGAGEKIAHSMPDPVVGITTIINEIMGFLKKKKSDFPDSDLVDTIKHIGTLTNHNFLAIVYVPNFPPAKSTPHALPTNCGKKSDLSSHTGRMDRGYMQRLPEIALMFRELGNYNYQITKIFFIIIIRDKAAEKQLSHGVKVQEMEEMVNVYSISLALSINRKLYLLCIKIKLSKENYQYNLGLCKLI